MKTSYAQWLVDDYFNVGKFHTHGFHEFFYEVNIHRFEPYNRQNVFSLGKTNAQCFEDALNLSRFFFESGAYIGVFDSASLYLEFQTFTEYTNFVRQKNSVTPEYAIGQANWAEYLLEIRKINKDVNAPSVTPDVEAIFTAPEKNVVPRKTLLSAALSLFSKTIGGRP
ncbi:MAG: hypothetical protein QM520_07125 [Gammaproteobacteria bacterium]|nr:hypothetical protein [Gammaproteobacteria bacterium]